VGDAGRLRRRQQVVRPLRAQPVRGGEEAVGMLQVGPAGVRRRQRGHLVHDRIRPGRGHRLPHRRPVQPVHHDGLGAELLEQAQLGRARRRGRHLVTAGGQLRYQPPSDGPRPAGQEHSHDSHLPDSMG
jgi:hypothetical protein